MSDLTADTLELLVRRHRPELDGPLTFTPIATGKFNTSFFVDAATEQLVLRIAPPRDRVFVFYERDMMRQEPQIHELVLSRTSVPVARIHAFDDSHELIDRDYLVMELLPGRSLTEMGHVNYASVLRQVGSFLAQVHRIEADRYGYLGAHCPMEPQKTWPAAFENMWNSMIDDIVSVGYYNPDESLLMRGLLERRLDLFDRPVPSSLLHMDIWHQNILVDEAGRVTGLVDWDRALWGDPEIEFAVLDYCGISEPPFWEGYGHPRDTSEQARTRQVFYLLYELQKYIVIRHGRSRDAGSAQSYKRQVLEIARKYLTR